MKYNVFVFTCSALLAMLLAWAVVAHPPVYDDDDDGISNTNDNCTETQNPERLDTDLDGYGNACDADYTQDGKVDNSDYATFQAIYNASSYAEVVDHNSDGKVNLSDYAIFQSLFGDPPGPSGQSCVDDCPGNLTGLTTGHLSVGLGWSADQFMTTIGQGDTESLVVTLEAQDGWAWPEDGICAFQFDIEFPDEFSTPDCPDYVTSLSESVPDGWIVLCNNASGTIRLIGIGLTSFTETDWRGGAKMFMTIDVEADAEATTGGYALIPSNVEFWDYNAMALDDEIGIAGAIEVVE